jgi:hypothetical protein
MRFSQEKSAISLGPEKSNFFLWAFKKKHAEKKPLI